VSTRVTSSRLIGRTTELAELEAALADAASGRPSLAFVAGESGVGKSRLLLELERRAVADGARVLCGDCVELGEGELPYAPIVAALRRLARDGDPALAELPPATRAGLAELLPELGPAPGAMDDERTGPPQARVFEALLTLLHRLGREAPLLLEIEDLHWADTSTRACLAFLARSLSRERVLVVATYRADELHRRHPLRPLLAELERAPSARRIELPRLSRDELREQLQDILGASPDAALLDRLWARSEGNPLFAEELIAAGLDGRGELPPTLRDALMLRVERLPETAQELLRLLAVGQRLDHELLADASGLDAATLRTALREAVAGHLVGADREGRYAFRHALLREVVHDDLLPGEHSELHLALARALERRAERQGDRAGAHITAGIAHHYNAAGDQRAALAAAVRAAAAADRVHAYGEAAALLERALELWPRVPDAEELAGADHVELLMRAANARQWEDASDRTADLLRAALAEIDASARPHRAAAVLERMSRAEWGLGRSAGSQARLDSALGLLPDDDRSPERASLLAWQAKLYMLQSRFAEAIAVARASLDEIRATGDASAASRVLNALGVALAASGAPEEGIAALREGLALSRRSDRIHDLESAVTNLSEVLHFAARTDEGLALAREGRAELTELGQACEWLDMLIAEELFAIGEWEAAHDALPAADERYVGTTRAYHDLVRTEIALGVGDHAEAAARIDDVLDIETATAEPQLGGVVQVLRAELARRGGDLNTARAAIDAALEAIRATGDQDPMRLALAGAGGMAVEADAAERARDLGEREAEALALRRADALLAAARRGVALMGPAARVEPARLATAEAEATRVAGRSDPERWAHAAAQWDALGRPYPAALARWREAEALAGAGDRDAAAVAAEDALAAARLLGAQWLASEVEGLAARARLRLGDEPGAAEAAEGGGDAQADADPFGLTPRERQVLAMLAAGATNREIGAALYMAEKTASVHVSRILAKLDVRSRTEAAAVAHRHGLAA
jgi:DNA-binding CsgD family transcriptional regulator